VELQPVFRRVDGDVSVAEPVPNDTTFRIAQNRKRQREVNPRGPRFFGCIDRDSYDARARRPDFQVALSVVRQLANAESSPIAPIKEENQATVQDQLRQPVWHSYRVWQFEFRCKVASDGNACHRPRLTLRLDVPGYFGYTRIPQCAAGRPTGCRSSTERPRLYTWSSGDTK